MRRSAALTVAALFLFTLTFVHGQAETTQTPQEPASSEKSKATEKVQSSEMASSGTQKAGSAEKQQNPFDEFQQFSAEVSGSPLHWDKMKIYRSGNKMRADYTSDYEVRITDLAKQRGWFMRHWVNKPEKCGPINKMDIATYPFFAYTGRDFKVERVPAAEPAEKETIDGHSTKIESYTVMRAEGGALVAKVKLWEAEDLKGFPIRMEINPPATKEFILSYTNVSLEKPDPKLFQVPAKCMQIKGPINESSPSSKSQSSKRPTSKPSNDSSAPPQ